MLLWVGLLYGATIAVRVDGPAGFSPDDRQVLERGIQAAIADRGHRSLVIEKSRCRTHEACARELLTNKEADELWSLSAIPAVTQTTLFVEISRPSGHEERQLKLAMDRTEWTAQLGALSRGLLGAPVAAVEKEEGPSAPFPKILLAKGAVVAGGAALVIGSIALYGSARGSEAQLVRELDAVDGDNRITGVTYDRAMDELSSINLRRNLSLGFAIAGSALVLSGALWFLVPSGDSEPSVALIPGLDGATVVGAF
ncbi:MAG: hypothetical protein U1E65_36450 [Myxococcota bacterium]